MPSSSSESLYLDTARLGLMSPTTRLACRMYAELVASEGCSAAFEEFLWHGSDVWPARQHRETPALSLWRGPDELKRQLANIAGVQDAKVFLASRSQALMRVAISILCEQCSTILTTDSEWPAYARILDEEASRHDVEIIRYPLSVRSRQLDGGERVAGKLAGAFIRGKCDGLFVSALTFQGIRVPVVELRQMIARRLSLAVVDGAQALGHLDASGADIFVSGAHKWLGASPLGIATCCTQRARDAFSNRLRQNCEASAVADPLIRFLEGNRDSAESRFYETVNVEPLLLCRAAINDSCSTRSCREERLARRVFNAQVVRELAVSVGWQPVYPQQDSGIVLLQSTSPDTQNVSCDVVRESFQERKISLTTYDDGLIRMSMPVRALTGTELKQLKKSLKKFR